VIDTSSQKSDLDVGGAGIRIVGFELGDDFGLNDGRH
jgi:hypothetical protein